MDTKYQIFRKIIDFHKPTYIILQNNEIEYNIRIYNNNGNKYDLEKYDLSEFKVRHIKTITGADDEYLTKNIISQFDSLYLDNNVMLSLITGKLIH
jgi:hypothetical protein